VTSVCATVGAAVAVGTRTGAAGASVAGAAVAGAGAWVAGVPQAAKIMEAANIRLVKTNMWRFIFFSFSF
jgi:hypothetical protein